MGTKRVASATHTRAMIGPTIKSGLDLSGINVSFEKSLRIS
jgi:hypothetical protein